MIYPGMLVAMLSIGGSPGREIIGFEQLVPRDGIFYEVGSEDPFTGTVVTYHENGLKKVSGEYFEGKRDGKASPGIGADRRRVRCNSGMGMERLPGGIKMAKNGRKASGTISRQ